LLAPPYEARQRINKARLKLNLPERSSPDLCSSERGEEQRVSAAAREEKSSESLQQRERSSPDLWHLWLLRSLSGNQF